MSGKHALLSPSSAHRWIQCPPSARLTETAEDVSSQYAAEGGCAHELAEYKLRRFLGENVKDPRENLSYFSADMDSHTDDYVQFCIEEYEWLSEYGKPLMLVEQKVKYDEYVPQGSGSVDCLIICGKEMVVIDLKFGAGIPISAEENPQLRLYALGAWLAFDSLFGEYGINDIKTVVFQPRRDNISTEYISAQNLVRWAEETVKPAAELAWNGEGKQSAGSWCQFCRIKAQCRTRAEANMALAAYDFELPALLGNDEIAEILLKVDDLVSWAGDVKEFALQQALKGVKFPGFKVVEGRSNRCYISETTVADTVTEAGYDPYEKSILGITKMESLLGKKQFTALLGSLVEKPQGKPVLVPETDKRQEINVNTAAQDFEEPIADHYEN